MNYKQAAKKLLPPIVVDTMRAARLRWGLQSAHHFTRNGGVPWTSGYSQYRQQFIRNVLADESILAKFRQGEALPPAYGVGIDERCIEVPWLLAHLGDRPEYLLDAGSALNHSYILTHPFLRAKRLHIMTLAPESRSFWQSGISYIYHDLRDNPMRSAFYDAVACISTLEHVGGDNTVFTQDTAHRENQADGFVLAMQGLSRVLKPGGQLFVTVPYGLYQDYGWFRQFDAARLAELIQAFGPAAATYQAFCRYTAQGWQWATAAECDTAEYSASFARARTHNDLMRHIGVEPDKAAAARAVACIKLVKPPLA